MKDIKIPHIIHGNEHHQFPTHTHGLCKVGLPELFINSNAFGVFDNSMAINELYLYLLYYPSEFEMVKGRKEVEIKLWGQSEMSLIIRPVSNDFAGVTIAYNETDIKESNNGFSQIYVKGDTHVLSDEYFIEQHRAAMAITEPCECAYCRK